MSAENFIDTNILIYQIEAADARKSAIAERIVRDGVATGNACISFQVVQECLNTVLRKAQITLDIDGARSYLETVLAPLFRVPATFELYQRSRYSCALQVWVRRFVDYCSRPRRRMRALI